VDDLRRRDFWTLTGVEPAEAKNVNQFGVDGPVSTVELDAAK